jgi:hypothetical protein
MVVAARSWPILEEACISVSTCHISAAGNDTVVAKGVEEVGM